MSYKRTATIKSSKNRDKASSLHRHKGAHDAFGSPERRAQIARADIIIAADPDQETRTIMYGREMLERIVQSGIGSEAAITTINLDTASRELDKLEKLVSEIKGKSSFRPADLFPEVVIDTASFASDPELLEPVRLAVEEIVAQHRTLLPPVQLRFYYSVAAAGFTTAKEELRCAAEEANEPAGYVAVLMTFGDLLQDRLSTSLIKPNRCMEVVYEVGDRGNKLGVRCGSLLDKGIVQPNDHA